MNNGDENCIARLHLAVRPRVKREMVRQARAAGLSLAAYLTKLIAREEENEFG
ncbi:hypothetical protein [Bradyrhizobium sp. CCBAU 45384]|uniref:hypothetical protein n=1 Tax=Bradyrhizobium sp. CCBAU 45384 TaxID=858428 RepID=UPI002305071A|nr:hypothetical protein [Bradyrhizobium sp. CCBAU 45384]